MKKLFLLSYTLFSIVLLAQAGKIDPSFKIGTGANYVVNSFALQSDNKILVGGQFNLFNGYFGESIVRINSNGSVDTSFISKLGPNSRVQSIVQQSDGKILIGGYFSYYDNVSRNNIVRLNNDGSLDVSFNPGHAASYVVNSILLQSDGKILIGGSFNKFNNVEINGIARLNSDGSLDETFNPGLGVQVGYSVTTLAMQNDGKILVGGDFKYFADVEKNGIVRLNDDGSLDNTFNTIKKDNNVNDIVIQPDGKILVAGGVAMEPGSMISNSLMRLNIDGAKDESFLLGNGFNSGIYSIALQPNGMILLVGSFFKYNDTNIKYIARIYNDGSLDNSFDPEVGPNTYIQSIALQKDGRILIGGEFTSYNLNSSNRIGRIFSGNELSVSDNEKSNIKIYPNPVKDILNIKNGGLISEFEIYSIEGKKVMTGNDSNNSGIDVSTLQKGNYLIKIKTKGKEQTTKFIKE